MSMIGMALLEADTGPASPQCQQTLCILQATCLLHTPSISAQSAAWVELNELNKHDSMVQHDHACVGGQQGSQSLSGKKGQ